MELITRTIYLSDDSGPRLEGKQTLVMAVSGEYGTRQLLLNLSGQWASMDMILCTFTNATNEPVSVEMNPDTKIVTVPFEAMQTADILNSYIVFVGYVGTTVYRDSTKLPYKVLATGNKIGGNAQDPTPSVYAQFVADVKGYAEAADASADDAANSASEAAESAQKAEEAITDIDAAKEAAIEAVDAEKDLAVAAAGEAAEAAEASAQSATKAKQDAAQAVTDIGTAKAAAITAVQNEATTQKAAVDAEGTSVKQDVDDEGAAQVAVVEAAGKAQYEKIVSYGNNKFASAIPDTASLTELTPTEIHAFEESDLDVTAQGYTRVWNEPYTRRTDTDTQYGVTRTTNADGSFTFSGTPTASTAWLALGGINVVSGHNYYFGGLVALSQNDYGWRSATSGYFRTANKITTATTSGSESFYLVAQNGYTYSMTVMPIVVDLTQMFGSGNEPTSTDDARIAWIESYAAEHPEYNAGEIVSLQSVEIEERSTNLFGLSDSKVGSHQNITYAVDGGNITLTATNSYSRIHYKVEGLTAGTTYRLLADTVTATTAHNRLYFDSTDAWTSDLGQKTLTQLPTAGFTFVPTTDTAYIGFYITAGTTSGTCKLTNLRLVEDGTSTDYVPYLDPVSVTIPLDDALQGINDVHDELAVSSGEITRNLKELTFDGTETWTYNSSANNAYVVIADIADYGTSYASTAQPFLCSKYTVVSHSNMDGGATNAISYLRFNASKIALCVRDTSYSSASDYQTGMKDVSVVYALATPTTENITATEVTALDTEPNVITTNCDSTVDYNHKTKHYIDSKLEEMFATISGS